MSPNGLVALGRATSDWYFKVVAEIVLREPGFEEKLAAERRRPFRLVVESELILVARTVGRLPSRLAPEVVAVFRQRVVHHRQLVLAVHLDRQPRRVRLQLAAIERRIAVVEELVRDVIRGTPAARRVEEPQPVLDDRTADAAVEVVDAAQAGSARSAPWPSVPRRCCRSAGARSNTCRGSRRRIDCRLPSESC